MEEKDVIKRRGMSDQPASSPSADLARLAQSSEESVAMVEKEMQTHSLQQPVLKKTRFFLPRKVLLLLIGIGIGVIIIFGVVSYILATRATSPVTLTYWGTTIDAKSMEPVIADFHKQYPYITVTYSQEDLVGYQDRLIARIPAGAGPDIYEYHVSWLPMFKHMLLPLNSIITPSDIKANYYKVVSDDLVHDNMVYGIPLGIDTLSLFVNEDILRASGLLAPTTWKQFSDTAYIVTVKDTNKKIKIAGAALGTFSNIIYAPDIISALLVQNGSDPLTIGQHIQQTIDTLTFYTSFVHMDTSVWDDTLDVSKTAFAKGTLGMYLGYIRDIPDIKGMNPRLNFAVYQLPHLPGRHITTASYFAEGISSQSHYSNAAKLFINYLNKKDTQQKLYESEVRNQSIPLAPVQPALAKIASGDNYLSIVGVQAADAVSSIFVGETGDTSGIDAQMNSYLQNIVAAQINNQVDADNVSTVTQGISTVLSKYK